MLVQHLSQRRGALQQQQKRRAAAALAREGERLGHRRLEPTAWPDGESPQVTVQLVVRGRRRPAALT